MADAGSEPGGSGADQSNPRARLMQEVAEEMDALESEFGDNYQIGRVITVIEVLRPNPMARKVWAYVCELGSIPGWLLGCLLLRE